MSTGTTGASCGSQSSSLLPGLVDPWRRGMRTASSSPSRKIALSVPLGSTRRSGRPAHSGNWSARSRRTSGSSMSSSSTCIRGVTVGPPCGAMLPRPRAYPCRVTTRWRRIWVSWERSSTTWARRKTWRQRSTRSRSPTPSSVGSSAGRPPRRGHDRDHHRKKPDPEERIPVGGVRVRVQRARGTARLRDAARAAVPIPQRGTRPRNRRMLSRSQSARAPRRRANAAPRAPSTRCR